MHVPTELHTTTLSQARARRRIRRGARRILAGAAVAAAALAITLSALAVSPGAARASHQQVAIFEEDLHLFSDPAATLQELRHLGVEMVRVPVRWSWFAPNPNSFHKPNFNGADPNAYPASAWTALDAVVLDAQADGIQVMMTPAAFAPLWAQAPGAARLGGKYTTTWAWEPSATEFGQFVHAVAERYSGSFVPNGSSTPLPHVGVWELYNEPNTGEALGPEAIDGSSVPDAPRMYRALADQAWSALQATGHAGDRVLIGALGSEGYQAPPSRKYPQGLPGTYGEMKPSEFVRELYCLDSNYHRYLGRAASLRGCPTTKAAYRNFRAQNPVLFAATGVSVHPYDLSKPNLPPTQASGSDPSWAEFAQIPHLQNTLDRVMRAYGSGKHFPIWNTEYGYITCPPNCSWHEVSPTTAAAYVNWAEYLSWRNPRSASTMQYLLFDPNPYVGVSERGGFANGLVFYDGMPKPVYYAYRMPIFLPYTKTSKGHSLEVWGDVRPAPFAVSDGDGVQYASIQFLRTGGRTWTTLKTLTVSDPHGYIDTWVTFPSSGSVRISWMYPSSDTELQSLMVTNSNGTIYSRTVPVTITPTGVKRDKRR